MSEQYYLYPQGIKTEVSYEVYKVFYSEQEKEKYQIRKEQEKNIFYYSDLDNGDLLGEDIIRDESEMDIISKIVENERAKAVYEALKELSLDEIKLIKAIYFDGMSQRNYGRISAIKQTTISHRHKKILKKLKKIVKI